MNPESSDAVTIERRDIQSPPARALIASLNAELSGLYPEEGATHFRLDPDEVSEGRGAFLVAFLNGQPVGCGAIRRISDDTAELKRMYVAGQFRGRGIARRILGALEAEAGRLGARRIVLETGLRQLAAIALYERAGYSRVPPFGEYLGSPLSVCMARALGSVSR